MTERLIVKTYFRGSLFGRLFKTQRAGADRDAIPVLQLPLEMRLPVDEDPIGAASQLTIYHCSIDDCEGPVLRRFDMRVISGRARIVDDHGIVRRAADCADPLRHQAVLPLPTARIGNL